MAARKYNQFTPAEKKALNDQLKACTSVEEMFSLLGSTFDLENAKPGFGSKGMIISGLTTALQMINPVEAPKSGGLSK